MTFAMYESRTQKGATIQSPGGGGGGGQLKLFISTRLGGAPKISNFTTCL